VLRFTQNGSIIPQREGTESVMTVNQLSANGDVDVTGNLTPAYAGNPAVQSWTRNIKFSQRKLTVTDNFAVTSGTQVVFQLDVPVQPVVSGNTITAGALKVRVVSPASPTINVVSQGKYRIDIGGGTTQYIVELSDQTISSTTTPPDTPPATPAPTVSLSASPSTVTSGSTGTLTWSSSNATSCSGTGSWSGTKATTGSEVTPSLTATSTFTISCTGAGGTASQSVVIGVGSVVVVTPTSGGLKIDLSYASQTSTAFSRFKSLVDDALAGRPDYGFAPEQAAYMYKMTGDVKYCDYAVTFAESCPNSYDRQYGINCGVQGMESDIAAGRQPYVAGDSYLEVGPIIGSLAVTYDWCGFRMTDSQKTRWKNIANQAIYNVWNPSSATWGGRSFPWSGWSISRSPTASSSTAS
jgi:hypothetical protein